VLAEGDDTLLRNVNNRSLQPVIVTRLLSAFKGPSHANIVIVFLNFDSGFMNFDLNLV
jgi:hypothetical protein